MIQQPMNYLDNKIGTLIIKLREYFENMNSHGNITLKQFSNFILLFDRVKHSSMSAVLNEKFSIMLDRSRYPNFSCPPLVVGGIGKSLGLDASSAHHSLSRMGTSIPSAVRS